MMLEGLGKLLGQDFEIVGTARDGRALLEAAETLRPDLVLADISMPGIDGIEAARRLRAAVPGTRVMILSIHTEPSWVRAAFAAGACGYLSKSSAPEEVELAVREVLEGRFYVSPIVARAALAPAAGAEAPGRRSRAWRPSRQAVDGEALTPREREVLSLVGKGLGNKEIARRLAVSVATVRTHLRKVYSKLSVASRLQLVLLAAQPGAAAM